MRQPTIYFSIAFMLILAHTWGWAQQAPMTEKGKIEYLIKSVRELDGAKFYRNGSYYNAQQAADHLSMKWSKAGGAVKSAQDFIDKIATKSSMSGEPYKIVLKTGKELGCKEFLTAKLSELNKANTPR